MAAPIAGRAADRGHGRAVLWAGGVSVVVAFGVLAVAAGTLLGLGAGAVLLEPRIWAAQTANQQRIFARLPEARGRMNAVYMVCYFAGGASGSALGAMGWSHGGWGRVSLVGAVMGCDALATMALAWIATRRGGAGVRGVE